MTGLAIDNRISNILEKAQDDGISREEASVLLKIPLMSLETRVLMYTADQLSREMFKGKGENHFHIGINIEPCPYNCLFCSLARQTGIFTENIDFQPDQVVEWARQAEKGGADALNIMTGGSYAFEKLLEVGRLLKKSVKTPLVANTRDITRKEGEKLLEAGFVGAYHAVRLGEGRDT
ncbi:MAG: hypothetical protein K9J83_07060, partial [Desulfarculaceae bacterium]|nr:hypothetical protein [Desulfarculaceae bacterium]